MSIREDEVRKLLQSWVDNENHDRCWYYPELFEQLCRLYGIKDIKRPQITRINFRIGCLRYEGEQYNDRYVDFDCDPRTATACFQLSQMSGSQAISTTRRCNGENVSFNVSGW